MGDSITPDRKPIALVIDHNQSTLLGFALTLMPDEIPMDKLIAMSSDSENKLGSMLGLAFMMLIKMSDKEEKAKLTEALKEHKDYTNSTIVVNNATASGNFVSKKVFKDVLDLAMKTHRKMYDYGISGEDVMLDDLPVFNTLVNAHKLLQ